MTPASDLIVHAGGGAGSSVAPQEDTCTRRRAPRSTALEPVPQVLWQRAGIEDRSRSWKKRSRTVHGFQERQQHVKAARRVEVHCRRHIAQVATVFSINPGMACHVDIETAAVAQYEVEVMVGAECVAPRQPIQDDRRPVFDERCIAMLAGYTSIYAW